jgi:hypothetical protein
MFSLCRAETSDYIQSSGIELELEMDPSGTCLGRNLGPAPDSANQPDEFPIQVFCIYPGSSQRLRHELMSLYHKHMTRSPAQIKLPRDISAMGVRAINPLL